MVLGGRESVLRRWPAEPPEYVLERLSCQRMVGVGVNCAWTAPCTLSVLKITALTVSPEGTDLHLRRSNCAVVLGSGGTGSVMWLWGLLA